MSTAAAPNLATIKLNLPKNRGAYYDGHWHEPKGGRYAETINPGTGEPLGGPDVGRGMHAVDRLFGRADIRRRDERISRKLVACYIAGIIGKRTVIRCAAFLGGIEL